VVLEATSFSNPVWGLVASVIIFPMMAELVALLISAHAGNRQACCILSASRRHLTRSARVKAEVAELERLFRLNDSVHL